MSDLTIRDLLDHGELGDTSLEVRLTARELAAVQYVLHLASEAGCLSLAYMAADKHGVGLRWSVAFQSAQARLGVALARALTPELATEFAALLARIDQEQTALDNGEESRGD